MGQSRRASPYRVNENAMDDPIKTGAAELNAAFNLYAWDDSKAEAESILRRHFGPILAENAKLRGLIQQWAAAYTEDEEQLAEGQTNGSTSGASASANAAPHATRAGKTSR